MGLKEQAESAPQAVFVLIGVAIAAFFFLNFGMGTEALLSQVESVKLQLEANDVKLKETLEIVKNKEKFQESMEKFTQTFRMALEYLPKELQVQDLLQKVTREARVTEIELTNFFPKEAKKGQFFDELPMVVDLSGSFPQLLKFLIRMAQIQRIVNVRTVEVKDPKVQDGIPKMKFTVTLIGYKYVEPVKPAASPAPGGGT